MEVVLESVRGYFEELLEPVTPELLYEAIQKDINPWEHAPPIIKKKGSTWTRNLKKYKDRITPQLVLDWLKADRPDLHNLIINMGPKGTRWLSRRTELFKEELWPHEGGLKLVQEGKPVQEDPEEEEEPLEQPEEEKVTVKWG